MVKFYVYMSYTATYGYIFRQKYPDFVKYAIDEVLNAKCCCCQDTLMMEDILMTVPCCHFLCGQYACNFMKIWSDNAEADKKCPMCRNYLIDQIFGKSIQYNMTSMTQNTFFIWIPTFIYIGKNLNQLIMESLREKKYNDAFRFSFLLNRGPNDIEMSIDKNWSGIYSKQREKLYCSSCRSALSIEKAFSATCNHFFCTICGTYILENRGNGIIQCPECNKDIEDSKSEIIFLDQFEIIDLKLKIFFYERNINFVY